MKEEPFHCASLLIYTIWTETHEQISFHLFLIDCKKYEALANILLQLDSLAIDVDVFHYP